MNIHTKLKHIVKKKKYHFVVPSSLQLEAWSLDFNLEAYSLDSGAWTLELGSGAKSWQLEFEDQILSQELQAWSLDSCTQTTLCLLLALKLWPFTPASLLNTLVATTSCSCSCSCPSLRRQVVTVRRSSLSGWSLQDTVLSRWWGCNEDITLDRIFQHIWCVYMQSF